MKKSDTSTSSVTTAQRRVLEVLKGANGLTMGAISNFLGCTPGNTTGLVLFLLNLGLVTRTENPRNRRERLIQITNAGLDLFKATKSGHEIGVDEVDKDFASEGDKDSRAPQPFPPWDSLQSSS